MTTALLNNVKSASIYVMLNHFSSQFIRLLSNLVLTRLLAPELFGVMAFVFTIIMALHMMSDLGVKQAVVRSQNATDEKFLKVAWTIKLIHESTIGIILISLGVVLALTQENIYAFDSAIANPDLPYVLMIISISQFLSGLTSIRVIDYFRRMKQKELLVLELISQIFSLFLMILLAYLYANIYALVIGSISASLIKLLMSYFYLNGVKSSICLERKYVKEVVTFGKWIILSSITGFVVNAGDKILLGFWVSATLLGFYSIAQILAQFIKQLVQKLMSSIYFPLLSDEVRKESSLVEIEKLYYKIRYKIDLVCCLSVGFIFTSANLIVSILYDDRYSEVADILKILAFSAVWVGGQLATQLFLAYGRSKLFSHVVSYQALVFLLVTPIFYYLFGFYGVVFSVVINPVIQYGFTCYYMKKYYFLSYRREFRGFLFIPVGMLLGIIFNKLVNHMILSMSGSM